MVQYHCRGTSVQEVAFVLLGRGACVSVAVRCWQPVAVAMPFRPRFLTVQSSWRSWTTGWMRGQLKVRPYDLCDS